MSHSNIELMQQNRYCSLSRRLCAAIVDSPLNFILSIIPISGIIYEVYFLSSERQATIGQSYCGIRCSTIEGNKITVLRAIYKTLVPFILVLVLTLILAFTTKIEKDVSSSLIVILTLILNAIPYFFTKRRQFVADWVAGVVVLHEYKNSQNQ
jgi:uncharacterized RDD family membrane protein YckC